jgi:hypothetical protein
LSIGDFLVEKRRQISAGFCVCHSGRDAKPAGAGQANPDGWRPGSIHDMTGHSSGSVTLADGKAEIEK